MLNAETIKETGQAANSISDVRTGAKSNVHKAADKQMIRNACKEISCSVGDFFVRSGPSEGDGCVHQCWDGVSIMLLELDHDMINEGHLIQGNGVSRSIM